MNKDPRRHAADLYWLAFLLTGRSGLSVDIAAEAVSLEEESEYFSIWMCA